MIPMRKSILIFALHSEFAHWRSFGASLDGIGISDIGLLLVLRNRDCNKPNITTSQKSSQHQLKSAVMPSRSSFVFSFFLSRQ